VRLVFSDLSNFVDQGSCPSGNQREAQAADRAHTHGGDHAMGTPLKRRPLLFGLSLIFIDVLDH